MRRLLVVTTAILITCGSGHAQTSMSTPAIGTTSPLGVPGSSGSAGSAGIGLGATEIDSGGLSPLPGANCGASASYSGSGMSGSASTGSSTYDGGGLALGSSATGSTGCTTTSSGMAATGSASTMAPAGTSLSGSGIGLGATELDSAGVSPLFTAPMPSLGGGTLGCAGSTTGSSTDWTPGAAAGSTSIAGSSGC